MLLLWVHPICLTAAAIGKPHSKDHERSTVTPDERSLRIALVTEQFVSRPPGGLDAVAVAQQAGWEVLQLPAAEDGSDLGRRTLAALAEQLAEFSRDGYEFALIGEYSGLREALAAVDLDMPDQIVPSSAAELLDFLVARPAPTSSSWSWTPPPGS